MSSASAKVNRVKSSKSLSAKAGTFTELQLIILAAREGDVIRLTRDYVYDAKFLLKNGIFINK